MRLVIITITWPYIETHTYIIYIVCLIVFVSVYYIYLSCTFAFHIHVLFHVFLITKYPTWDVPSDPSDVTWRDAKVVVFRAVRASYPAWDLHTKSHWKWPLIVEKNQLENDDFLHSFLYVYQRVWPMRYFKWGHAVVSCFTKPFNCIRSPKKPTGSCKKVGTWCPTALKMDDFTLPIDVVHKTNEIPICQILNLQ